MTPQPYTSLGLDSIQAIPEIAELAESGEIAVSTDGTIAFTNDPQQHQEQRTITPEPTNGGHRERVPGTFEEYLRKCGAK